ncbi:S-acyl fatty acid synthase thioesterase, medium chain-like [Ostrea edulis]|uniref:S-acyl fatty acid synthase thioesterase, medium chain-like n=1 Tax=Ostrea edulis TaxID=37623 RepID=UPI0024AEE582|nr:S-acyl fatty acid synthase thioesterase, medium chain-like [Ostrea edulis]XP_048773153.2 S-acyl fatty acid synthase thioesterase, medium chain-like [Ostrea edulis]XP_048773154.2 S-acyl fatty acid synthase thioesterase, medium chain-like [Ostrea edulis]
MVDKFLNCRYAKPNAKYALICFPWAGGGSNFYAQWGRQCPDSVEVCGITLPGRESRFRDPCTTDADQILQDTCSAIYKKYCNTDIIFWGHSMGALYSFETALLLKKLHHKEPVRMFCSGISAPHAPERKHVGQTVNDMSEEEFVEYLKKLGGTPEQVLSDPEMMTLFLPPLKADYVMMEGFKSPIGVDPPLSCPLHLFDGQDDAKHNLKAWEDVTSGKTTVQLLPGGHFYPKEPSNQSFLISYITERLN